MFISYFAPLEVITHMSSPLPQHCTRYDVTDMSQAFNLVNPPLCFITYLSFFVILYHLSPVPLGTPFICPVVPLATLAHDTLYLLESCNDVIHWHIVFFSIASLFHTYHCCICHQFWNDISHVMTMFRLLQQIIRVNLLRFFIPLHAPVYIIISIAAKCTSSSHIVVPLFHWLMQRFPSFQSI